MRKLANISLTYNFRLNFMPSQVDLEQDLFFYAEIENIYCLVY